MYWDAKIEGGVMDGFHLSSHIVGRDPLPFSPHPGRDFAGQKKSAVPATWKALGRQNRAVSDAKISPG